MLLQDNSHIVRFHNLRAQQDIVPWCLQVTMRDPEMWTLLNDPTHCTVWGLLGMSVKQHNQQMSKQAQVVADLLGKPQAHFPKGTGKGKSKTKGQRKS